jgi:hypothetical protein
MSRGLARQRLHQTHHRSSRVGVRCGSAGGRHHDAGGQTATRSHPGSVESIGSDRSRHPQGIGEGGLDRRRNAYRVTSNGRAGQPGDRLSSLPWLGAKPVTSVGRPWTTPMLTPAPDGRSWSFGTWVIRPIGGPGPMGMTARWWVATRPGKVVRRDRLGILLLELRRWNGDGPDPPEPGRA